MGAKSACRFRTDEPELLRVEENVDKALRFLERTRADLMVLPELFNTGYNFSAVERSRSGGKIPNGYTCQKTSGCLA